MAYKFLVASYTDSIVTIGFEPRKSSLHVLSSLKVGHHPSWISRHSSDSSIFFAGLEQSDGRLLTLKFDAESGSGEVLNDSPSGGSDPCTILVTDEDVLVGNVCQSPCHTLPLSLSSSTRLGLWAYIVCLPTLRPRWRLVSLYCNSLARVPTKIVKRLPILIKSIYDEQRPTKFWYPISARTRHGDWSGITKMSGRRKRRYCMKSFPQAALAILAYTVSRRQLDR